MFSDFVRTFQKHTVGIGRLGSQEVMYKYISTLEYLAPRFGTETFAVSHLELREDDDGSGSYLNSNHAQGATPDSFRADVTHDIMVSGCKGIQWRKASVQKVCVCVRVRTCLETVLAFCVFFEYVFYLVFL